MNYVNESSQEAVFLAFTQIYWKRPLDECFLVYFPKCFRRVVLANKWVKVFKNGTGKICGIQPLKNLRWYGLLCFGRPYHCLIRPYHFKFLKALFYKFYLTHSEIPWRKCCQCQRCIQNSFKYLRWSILQISF